MHMWDDTATVDRPRSVLFIFTLFVNTPKKKKKITKEPWMPLIGKMTTMIFFFWRLNSFTFPFFSPPLLRMSRPHRWIFQGFPPYTKGKSSSYIAKRSRELESNYRFRGDGRDIPHADDERLTPMSRAKECVYFSSYSAFSWRTISLLWNVTIARFFILNCCFFVLSVSPPFPSSSTQFHHHHRRCLLTLARVQLDDFFKLPRPS